MVYRCVILANNIRRYHCLIEIQSAKLQREFIDKSRDIKLEVIHCIPILLSLEGIAQNQNN